MLDPDNFKESLRRQFRDDVKMIITECHGEHSTFLDIELLNKRLVSIHNHAVNIGLSENDWLDLVFEICPEIYDSLDFGPMAA
ncbi:MAG: hypothetical protein N4A33_10435 [Bacteriovoracaceae bacterium]|jgi:hypothetical protein|nr:hypothetical protein [Bacteriovoracaceae bacterium]